jgi:hypothetical protein
VNYVLPDLTLPFETATHPQAARAQELTEAWCRRFGLLRTPRVVAKFHALGYGRIMATLCPYAPLDGLSLVTDWNSFFFITDDQQNIGVTTDRLSRYEELVASMRRVIAGECGRHSHPLLAALQDLLGRTLPGRPDYWVARFRANLDCWLTGHLYEDSFRASATVPTEDEYVMVRRDASTVLPTLDLVTVLDHHENLGVQKAIDAVAERVAARADDHLAAFLELPKTLRRQENTTLERVLRCALDMQSWAAGMENWDRTDTIRFSDQNASYVEDLLEVPCC